MVDVIRRRRGPKPRAADDLRGHCVSVRLNPDELARLDAERGAYRRGEWLRRVWLGSVPPAPVPPINREAWFALSKVAGNLATIATAMRGGEYVELSKINAEVAAFRNALIGVKKDEGNAEN